MTRIEISLCVRADAALRLADLARQRAAAAELTGPFVVMPEMDPLPIPPTDDAVLTTELPSVPVLVRSEELRELMRQFEAGELV